MTPPTFPATVLILPLSSRIQPENKKLVGSVYVDTNGCVDQYHDFPELESDRSTARTASARRQSARSILQQTARTQLGSSRTDRMPRDSSRDQLDSVRASVRASARASARATARGKETARLHKSKRAIEDELLAVSMRLKDALSKEPVDPMLEPSLVKSDVSSRSTTRARAHCPDAARAPILWAQRLARTASPSPSPSPSPPLPRSP
jgi:hypothetical protein